MNRNVEPQSHEDTKVLEPGLRFTGFIEPWETKRIGDISKVSSGGTPNRGHKEYWEGNIPWITTSQIDFGVISSANEYITEEGLKNSSAKLFPKGTILMAMYGQGKTRGQVAKLDIEATTNQACAAFLTDEEIVSNDYLFQSLVGKYHQLRNLSNQGGQDNLSAGLIKSLKLNLPRLEEQQKIADFLSSVDKKIEQLTEKHRLLTEYKKGVMQQIFTQQIRFKDNQGNDYPEWEEKQLGEFISQSAIKNKDLDETLVLSVNNKKGFISQEEQFDGYEVASSDLTTYKIVKQNQYAYNPSRINVGSIARLKKYSVGIVSPMYVVFELSENLISEYFENLYTTHKFKHLIKVGCSGSVRDSLNFKDLSAFNISVPCISEQQKIANFLTEIDQKIDQAWSILEQTKAFKKGLLQKMFV